MAEKYPQTGLPATLPYGGVFRRVPVCVLTRVHSMNEVYPLEKAAEAYDRMMSGKARFRVVLTTGL